jgi:hypothetical protein
MTRRFRIAAALGAMLGVTCLEPSSYAQKTGGTLKISFFDNPASMSLHEAGDWCGAAADDGGV